MRFAIFISSVASVIVFSACGNYHQDFAAANGKEGEFDTLSFDAVKALVFQPNCFHCHSAAGGNSGGVNLETYENAFPHIKDIRDDVSSDDMPMGGPPVAANEKTILFAWIDAGAPETSNIPLPTTSPRPTPSPSPSPNPLPDPVPSPSPTPTPTPVFQDVEKKIFAPHCISCHKNMATASYVKANIKTIVSKIDSGEMPKNSPALSADLKTLLHTWVNSGML